MDADDWQAPPGTVKRDCSWCKRPFAARADARTCPTCRGRSAYRASREESVFAPQIGIGRRPSRPKKVPM